MSTFTLGTIVAYDFVAAGRRHIGSAIVTAEAAATVIASYCDTLRVGQVIPADACTGPISMLDRVRGAVNDGTSRLTFNGAEIAALACEIEAAVEAARIEGAQMVRDELEEARVRVDAANDYRGSRGF